MTRVWLPAAWTAAVLGSIVAGGPQGQDPPAAPHYTEHVDLTYVLDDQNVRQPIRTKDDWERRVDHIKANMQKVMGPLPDAENKVPLEMESLEKVVLPQFVRQKIRYRTDADDRVTAWLFTPTNQQKPLKSGKYPAMLCLHQTIAIGKSEPAGMGGSPNLHYALELANRGYVVLAPDYPSFGEHPYDFDPKHGYQSGSMKAVWDNIRGVDLLQSLPIVDGERIGCIGHSLGGHNTMFTAVFEPRIKCMVSSCGFTRFHKYYEGKLAGWTSARYMPRIAEVYQNDPDKVPFDFTEIVGAFAPRPFFTNSPTGDGNFEVSGVRDVISAARPIYELYGKGENLVAEYPESGHDFPREVRMRAYEFLDKHLKP